MVLLRLLLIYSCGEREARGTVDEEKNRARWSFLRAQVERCLCEHLSRPYFIRAHLDYEVTLVCS